MKKTTVTALGIALPSLLTGLVHATPGYTKCHITRAAGGAAAYFIYDIGGPGAYSYGYCFAPMICYADYWDEQDPNGQGTKLYSYHGSFGCESYYCRDTLPWWLLPVPPECGISH